MEPTLRVVTALRLLKETFLLRPELRLEDAEAVRLCEVEADLCHALLHALQDVRFLARDTDGRYRLALPEPLES